MLCPPHMLGTGSPINTLFARTEGTRWTFSVGKQHAYRAAAILCPSKMLGTNPPLIDLQGVGPSGPT